MIDLKYAAALILLVWIAVAATVRIVVHGQERPARQTRQWQAATIAYDWMTARVDVVDMEGVCLYVVIRAGENVAIAAVPKTQLPHGAGCQ